MTLSDLIAEVERAEGPSREIDAAVAMHFRQVHPSRVTESVDAVDALIRWKMPKGGNVYGFEMVLEGKFCGCEAYIQRNNVNSGHWHYEGRGKGTDTSAIARAFLAAFLRAARARQENDTP